MKYKKIEATATPTELSRRDALRGIASLGIVAVSTSWLASNAKASQGSRLGKSALNEACGCVCTCTCDGCTCGTCGACACPGSCSCDLESSEALTAGIQTTRKTGNENSLTLSGQSQISSDQHTSIKADPYAHSIAADIDSENEWIAGIGVDSSGALESQES